MSRKQICFQHQKLKCEVIWTQYWLHLQRILEVRLFKSSVPLDIHTNHFNWTENPLGYFSDHRATDLMSITGNTPLCLHAPVRSHTKFVINLTDSVFDATLERYITCHAHRNHSTEHKGIMVAHRCLDVWGFSFYEKGCVLTTLLFVAC